MERRPTPPTTAATTPAVADPGARVRTLARLLDSVVRIPGTNATLGLDAILGLVPGLGDVAGAALSGYIILAAAQAGAPTSVISRMLLNVGVDTLIGVVPLAGDLFDVAWRANMRNAALLDRHLAAPVATRRSSGAVVAAVVGGVVLLGVVGAALTVAVVRLLARLAT